MKIPGLFRKSGLVLAFAAALAGCGPGAIGPKAETPDLRGETTLTEVFNGGPRQYATRISGAALQEKQSYATEGRLEIDGDIPAHVSITVRDGELVVNGDVGDGARIDVSQPVATHNERYPDFCYGYDFMAGKFKYSYKFTGCDHTVVDGLRYDDPDPAVNITGHVGQDVHIATNGRIVVTGQQQHNSRQLAPAPRPSS